MPTEITKIKEFFLKHETKIMLFVGFCLVSAISYEFGVLQGQKWQQKPLVIEKLSDVAPGQESVTQVNSDTQGASKTASLPSQAAKATLASNTANPPVVQANCAYVGSKNSTKFYLPTCSYAKRVKPENLACFKSAEEAIGQGRTESKCNTTTKTKQSTQ
ncbi:MAG: hypothetical protein PHW24_01670 [Candidatus Moranbacteria bacterium]|nr:hypothetical protein [Candidatus Moranbacteria bacterium]